ncbi:MAG TPA: glycosyltransferase family 2 protein [Solirubrobacterales bacterium]
MSGPRNSLVIPVYGNRDTIEALVAAVEGIGERIDGDLEAIFVVDGSPDDSRDLLAKALGVSSLEARVVEHSRNFGSFAAIRTGMSLARGGYIAAMAADLQEPPELVVEFLNRLHGGGVDVVAGKRASRDDRGDAFSKLYWLLYRRFVMSEIPVGGADVFACTAGVRDVVCSLEHTHTSLIGQLFWVGFRRQLISYDRGRSPGESGWTLRRKLRYLSDSVFAFTDLPVRMLWLVGLLGMVVGVLLAIAVFVARVAGTVSVPGYTATILVIVFFGSFNMIGLGIIGSYVWRAYDTVKGRPGAIVRDVLEFPAERDANG